MRSAVSPLGLPPGIRACLFDLDGVLTRTAELHAQAWRQMFDDYLQERAGATGEAFVPFDQRSDYHRYVDGKPRLAGTRDFLASREIWLPEGEESDEPGAATVWGLSNRKNDLVGKLMRSQGVQVYEGSVAYLRAARACGLGAVVVTSSANAAAVLDAAGLTDLVEHRVDGVLARARNLAGKPAPDTFLAGAAAAGVEPAAAAVFEDALAGVAAGRAGNFGLVVGVDRVGQADALREHGADLVVDDLARLLR